MVVAGERTAAILPEGNQRGISGRQMRQPTHHPAGCLCGADALWYAALYFFPPAGLSGTLTRQTFVEIRMRHLFAAALVGCVAIALPSSAEAQLGLGKKGLNPHNVCEVDKLLGEGTLLTVLGYHVIDGDKTDLRFLDDKGVVVGLYAKAKGLNDSSGFVVETAEVAGRRVALPLL